MKKGLVLLLSIACFLCCNKDIPELEFTWLLLGNACEGEQIMEHLEDNLINLEPDSHFAFLNDMAEAVDYPSIDLSNNMVSIAAYVQMVNTAPEILSSVRQKYSQGNLSSNLLEELEFTALGKDRCCVVACDCGTVDTMIFQMYDVGKIKGIQTCRYFRGLAEGPYEEVKKLFDENKDDLPPELVNLGPILESIWSPGESCDYDVSDGPCEEANE